MTPTASTVPDRQHKANILAAVLGYIAARDCEVPFLFFVREMADQFGTDADDIQTEVINALAALGCAGAVEIGPNRIAGFGYSFGADTVIKATDHIRSFTHFEPHGPDELPREIFESASA